MPSFDYEAMSSDGKVVRDRITAKNADDAIARIRELNLFPTRVKAIAERRDAQARAPGARPGRPARRRGPIVIGGVRGKDVTTFTRQLSTLTDAGIAIVRSLNILEHQMRPCALKNVVAGVSADVEGGSTLSEAMSRHPKAFDDLYANMVKAGEAGGVLDVVLQRLADFREKSARLKRRVISAMIYPAAVITFACLILVVIIIWIIPSFMTMFTDLGVTLPTPTRILLGVTSFVVAFWWLLPVVPVGIFVFFKLIGKTKTGRYCMDWFKFNVPIFGSIIRKGAIARFTRTFGTLISSGVPILEALTISRDTAGNTLLAGAIRDVHDSIREGEPIAAPLAQTRICDDIVVNMIDVGEETGNLDTMLTKIADNYDEQVDVAVEGMRSLLEPVMVIGLGLIVGFIVIALFMPLVKLIETLS